MLHPLFFLIIRPLGPSRRGLSRCGISLYLLLRRHDPDPKKYLREGVHGALGGLHRDPLQCRQPLRQLEGAGLERGQDGSLLLQGVQTCGNGREVRGEKEPGGKLRSRKGLSLQVTEDNPSAKGFLQQVIKGSTRVTTEVVL